MPIDLTPEQKAAVIAEYTAESRLKRSESMRRMWANKPLAARSEIMRRVVANRPNVIDPKKGRRKIKPGVDNVVST
jgi:hypothetical protein